VTDEPGRPAGEGTDEPAEGDDQGGGASTQAPHPDEPAEGDRAESAQDAP
jgi:hypothetical protein